jgi:DNA polymerase III gamma/tau subunit
VTAKVLDEMLPPAQDERIIALLRHAAGGEANAVLADLDGLLAAGQGLEVFCNDVIQTVRTLMLVRTCGPDAAMVDIPAGARDEYIQLSQRFELSHYVQMIGMLEELRRNVRYSGVGRALTEAVLVRFARLREWASIEQLLKQLPTTPSGDEKKKSPPAPVATSRPPPAARSRPTPQELEPEPTPAVPSGRQVSAQERRQIEQDPVVQKALELFDGILVHVERRAPAEAQRAPE